MADHKIVFEVKPTEPLVRQTDAGDGADGADVPGFTFEASATIDGEPLDIGPACRDAYLGEPIRLIVSITDEQLRRSNG